MGEGSTGTTCQNRPELAGFDRFYVNLETSGLFRWAWRIQNVELTGPHANVVVRPGGKLNRAALIAKLNEDKKPRTNRWAAR